MTKTPKNIEIHPSKGRTGLVRTLTALPHLRLDLRDAYRSSVEMEWGYQVTYSIKSQISRDPSLTVRDFPPFMQNTPFLRRFSTLNTDFEVSTARCIAIYVSHRLWRGRSGLHRVFSAHCTVLKHCRSIKKH